MRAFLGMLLVSTSALAADPPPHNVVLFVADGLRPSSVTPDVAPAMHALMENGVRFTNTHSLFPTFTTANASGMATGHLLGDSGDFSNYIYAAMKVPAANGSVTPFLENDAVLGQMNSQFGGNYLSEESILAAARAAGYSTAAIGKVGPVHIFDVTESTGQGTINIDDQTGTPNGLPIQTDVEARLRAASLPLATPGRGANGTAGTSTTPGTTVANVVQQAYFARVTTEAVLPLLKERGKPFVLVFWSRDPDGTQHNQGDSLLSLTPGIEGPTSVAAVHNADDDLAQIQASLRQLGLDGSTDVILTSDHGFSTISKQSSTSNTATRTYPGVPAGLLPRGFVGIDLAIGLGKTLFDPDNKYAAVDPNTAYTNGANAVIGDDPNDPLVVVAANGGSDLIYVKPGDRTTLERVVQLLSVQDYTSGLFVDDAFGAVPGTLPMSAVGLKGNAATPQPSVAISFRTFDSGCGRPTACGVEVADSALQQGQGMHGTFGRGDTMNTMGAIGPDFLTHFTDPAPASNADLGITIARLLHLDIPAKGKLVGRVLSEAMVGGGAVPAFSSDTMASPADSHGIVTRLDFQKLGDSMYFDAAGYPGRTLGLR